VWTHLDGLGGLQRLLRRDAHLPLPQQLLGEVGDVPTRDGDVLYTAADDVALSLRERSRGSEHTHTAAPCPRGVVFGWFLSVFSKRLQTRRLLRTFPQARFLEVSPSFRP